MTTDERREALDRWSQEHDRAQAYLTCTQEGRTIIHDLLAGLIPGRPPYSEPRRRSQKLVAEHPAGAGFVDVFGSDSCLVTQDGSAYDPASGEASYERRIYVLCEVKTGVVVAGEVLRQLRRYEAHFTLARDEERSDAPNPDVLVILALAHTKPLTVAARDLLCREGVVRIDLGSDPKFAAYGVQTPAASV